MNATDTRIDRMYELLPAIYRVRDADSGYPLRALLRVIAEQVDVVEDDIAGLYENWFIETCSDWVVPYIGDLVGYVPVAEAEPAPDATSEPLRALVPRREVANLIRSRRRKGTLALLEELAEDIAGWPAHAVEYFRLLGWTQNINHLHERRHRTVDLHDSAALERLAGPFDSTAHSVDIRRINSTRTLGRYNIPSIGVFVWRLRSYSVTRTSAYCVEDAGPQCFSFSALGQDAPLFMKPPGLPMPVPRSAIGNNFSIWADGWAGFDPQHPLPASALIPADLSGWTYVPPLKHVAVDPVLGRIVFPPSQLPRKGVRVSYCYGFSADMGGGEYSRPLEQPLGEVKEYRIGEGANCYHKIADALAAWTADEPAHAVMEFTTSGVYVEPLNITLAPGQYLQLRAANRVRPVLRLIDWQTDLPDAMTASLSEGSRLVLDGLMITGRPLQIIGADRVDGAAPASPCGALVVIRHCTLVPGWSLECDCEPRRPNEPSLELTNVRARVCIEKSIVGAIRIHEDQVAYEPIPLTIADSIVDSTRPGGVAIGPVEPGWAHTQLTIQRSTVFGIVDVRAMQLAENSIFTACVNVGRRQLGCMRFCRVPSGCRTPRRHACVSVTPQFTSVRYGEPGYAQLGAGCPVEIVRGADDGSEMGAFHDLAQPQRAANLRARLAQYTAAGMDVGLLFAS